MLRSYDILTATYFSLFRRRLAAPLGMAGSRSAAEGAGIRDWRGISACSRCLSILVRSLLMSDADPEDDDVDEEELERVRRRRRLRRELLSRWRWRD